MSVHDFSAVLKYGSQNPATYICDNASVRHPTREELPWPIEHIFRHHRKHIFIPPELPSIRTIASAVEDWHNKRKSQHTLSVANEAHSSPGCTFWVRRLYRTRRTRTAPCSRQLGKHVGSYVRKLKSAIMAATKKSLSRFSKRRHFVSNIDPISK